MDSSTISAAVVMLKYITTCMWVRTIACSFFCTSGINIYRHSTWMCFHCASCERGWLKPSAFDLKRKEKKKKKKRFLLFPGMETFSQSKTGKQQKEIQITDTKMYDRPESFTTCYFFWNLCTKSSLCKASMTTGVTIHNGTYNNLTAFNMI